MLYTKKQTDLVLESLKKWVYIVDGTGIDEGTKNCALCREYYVNINWIEPCTECPIFEITGMDNCRGTPYWEWVEAAAEKEAYGSINTIRAAKAELKFLEDLYNKTILFRKFEV